MGFTVGVSHCGNSAASSVGSVHVPPPTLTMQDVSPGASVTSSPDAAPRIACKRANGSSSGASVYGTSADT